VSERDFFGYKALGLAVDDFSKYEAMRSQGATPDAIYAKAAADGLDPITLIRLVRLVCGLTLAQVKVVSGAAAALDAKQQVNVGDTVHWEGWDTVQGFYVMEAKVANIVGGKVEVADHRKQLVTPSGLEGAAIEEPTIQTIPMSYFDRSLADRLGESLRFALDVRDSAAAGATSSATTAS
jgi:hypothetical protein